MDKKQIIPLLTKLSKYAFVGVINCIVCVGVMLIFAKMHFNYVIYTALGYIAAFLSSFFLNLSFTFHVQGDIAKRLSIFVSINLLNLLQVEFLQIFLIQHLKLEHVLAIMLGMIWYGILGFVLNQKFVFQRQIS